MLTRCLQVLTPIPSFVPLLSVYYQFVDSSVSDAKNQLISRVICCVGDEHHASGLIGL